MTYHLLRRKCSYIWNENNLQHGFYISSKSYSSLASDIPLLWALLTWGRLIIDPLFQRMVQSKCTKQTETRQTLFPPKSAQGTWLSRISSYPPKKEGTELRLMDRVGHFSHIPCFRGPERSRFDLRKAEVPQGVPSLICKGSGVCQVYCWLEEEAVWCVFLTFIIKHTKIWLCLPFVFQVKAKSPYQSVS